MSGDAVLERTIVQEAEGGVQHDVVVMQKYIPPAGDENEYDVHKDYDMWCAGRVYGLLIKHYPGHLWCVESDVKAHLVKISIPILMGIGDWYVINLKTHELTQGNIIVAGGEILERYGLFRGIMNDGAFLDARAKYSKLVDKSRGIPD